MAQEHGPLSWEEFHAAAHAYLDTQQARLRSEYQLGAWERYDYDQGTETLTFSQSGQPRLVARIQIVGSVSNLSATWLWAWDNPTVLEPVRRQLLQVREFGRLHGFLKLTEPQWPGAEVDGWAMTMAAAYLLGAQGAYRSPSDAGALFMVLFEPRLLDS